jgi:hypothetical protein
MGKKKQQTSEVVQIAEEQQTQQNLETEEEIQTQDLWVLEAEQNGTKAMTRPCSLKEIEQVCSKNKIGGMLYYCQLVPSHRIEIAVDFGWEKSPLLKR